MFSRHSHSSQPRLQLRKRVWSNHPSPRQGHSTHALCWTCLILHSTWAPVSWFGGQECTCVHTGLKTKTPAISALLLTSPGIWVKDNHAGAEKATLEDKGSKCIDVLEFNSRGCLEIQRGGTLTAEDASPTI